MSTAQLLLPERRLRRSTSDLDRLPVEIISIIFILYLEGTATIKYPLRLGAICRTWRDIAWSDPHLWTSFSRRIIEARHLSEVRNELTQDWLSRSGRLPLDISIWISPSLAEDSMRPLLQQLLMILNQHADQWSSIDFHMPADLLAQLNAFFTASDVRDITLRNTSESNAQLILPSFAHIAPETVELHDVLLQPSLDWSNVTEFTMSMMPVDHLFQVMKTAPNLQECRFVLISHPQEESFRGPVEHFTHRQIESLFVNFGNNDIEELFISNISLPALRSLGCQCTLHADALISLIERSSCKLESLTVDDVDYSGEDLVDIVRATPSLQILSTVNSFEDESEFRPLHYALNEQITSPTSPTAFLPALRIFDYSGEGFIDIPCEIIEDLLRPLSRDGTCRPLERVEVHSYYPPETDQKIPLVIYEDAISVLQATANRASMKLEAQQDETMGISIRMFKDMGEE